jgi:hypothetical protein
MTTEEAFKYFVDVAAKESRPLYKKEAYARSEQIENVSYRLAYALYKGGETFEGQVEIKFDITNDHWDML